MGCAIWYLRVILSVETDCLMLIKNYLIFIIRFLTIFAPTFYTIMEYNEKKAIQFILSRLPEDRAKTYSDNEILNVIDIIWDFYEESGLLDPATAMNDDEDDEEKELAMLTAHVKKMLSKDKGSTILSEDVDAIIAAEIEYENSIL